RLHRQPAAVRPGTPAPAPRPPRATGPATTRLLVLPPDLRGAALPGDEPLSPPAQGAPGTPPDGIRTPDWARTGAPAPLAVGRDAQWVAFPQVPSATRRAPVVVPAGPGPRTPTYPDAPHDPAGRADPAGTGPRQPVPAAGPRRPPAPVAVLVLPDGRTVAVQRTTLLGRRPVLRDGLDVVELVDPACTVSKTHAQLDVSADGLWLADCGSTNGTLVVLPTGDEVQVLPGRRVRLAAGVGVRLGGLALEVRSVPGTPRVDAPGAR
uniref:FHA domain-containing protein n=1 Tax=Cellulomonas endophytica TaxID=2494735 RepID=UPI001010C233